jgi:hypothetical protein
MPASWKLTLVTKDATEGSRHASATPHPLHYKLHFRRIIRGPFPLPRMNNLPKIEHVIKDCPRYTTARAAYFILKDPDLSLSTLFDIKKGGKALRAFLEVTKACFKPQEEAFNTGRFSLTLSMPPLLLTRIALTHAEWPRLLPYTSPVRTLERPHLDASPQRYRIWDYE